MNEWAVIVSNNYLIQMVYLQDWFIALPEKLMWLGSVGMTTVSTATWLDETLLADISVLTAELFNKTKKRQTYVCKPTTYTVDGTCNDFC